MQKQLKKLEKVSRNLQNGSVRSRYASCGAAIQWRGEWEYGYRYIYIYISFIPYYLYK